MFATNVIMWLRTFVFYHWNSCQDMNGILTVFEFTSVWPVSKVWMKPVGWLHKNWTPYSLTKMCERAVFHTWVMYNCLHITEGVKTLKIWEGSSIKIKIRCLIDELYRRPPTLGNDLWHSTQANERSLTKASWDQNNQNRRLLLSLGKSFASDLMRFCHLWNYFLR